MEIGSEFWNEFKPEDLNSDLQIPKWLKIGHDQKLLLSGRTAIDFVIKDIKLKKEIKLAYLPSYCCYSMVKPFIDNGITVDFYNVKYSKENGFKYDIDYNKSADLFLAMNYYGFSKSEMTLEMENFRNNNKDIIIIEDITHSMLYPNESIGDYGIASIRKWLPIPSGGIGINYKDEFKKVISKSKKNQEYINLRLKAMELKFRYMETGKEDLKINFLLKYKKANDLLINYKGIEIDDISLKILNNININQIKEKRQVNIDYIYNNLRETSNIQFIYKNIDMNMCPIFIPIRLDKYKRDSLREHLINNKIYIPIHWNYYPIGIDWVDLQSINETILSLVCDQRYGIKEMEYMIRIINEFMESN